MRIRASRGPLRNSTQWPQPDSPLPQLCIVAQLEGRCTVEQGDLQLRLTPESWAVWELCPPPRVCHEGGFDQVALFVPRAALGGEAELKTGLQRPISGHHGPGRLVFESVRALADELGQLARGDVDCLSGVILELVRITLGPRCVHRHASATSLSEK